MNAHPLSAYLEDCLSRYKTGATTPEASLHSSLEMILYVVGKKLKPRVRCFMNVKNQSGDMPDGGPFTPDQIPNQVLR